MRRPSSLSHEGRPRSTVTVVSARTLILLVSLSLLVPSASALAFAGPGPVGDVRRPDVCVDTSVPPHQVPPNHHLGRECGPETVRAVLGPLTVNVTVHDDGPYLTSVGVGLVCAVPRLGDRCPQFMLMIYT